MLKILFAGCLGLSPVILTQFTLEMCVAASNRGKKFTKNPYSGVQGRSRSSMLVPPESFLAVLVMICSKPVCICNRFHARRANSGKITISKGVPLFDARVHGESPHPAAQKFKTLETLGYHMVKTRSLYLTWPLIGTGS